MGLAVSKPQPSQLDRLFLNAPSWTRAFGQRLIGVQEARARSGTARSALIWEIPSDITGRGSTGDRATIAIATPGGTDGLQACAVGAHHRICRGDSYRRDRPSARREESGLQRSKFGGDGKDRPEPGDRFAR